MKKRSLGLLTLGLTIILSSSVSLIGIAQAKSEKNVSGGPITVKPGLDTTGQVLHAVNIKHTLVRDNVTTGIVTIICGDHNAITDFTLAHNTVSGVHSPFNLSAIGMVAGRQNFFDANDPGGSENQLDVTIVNIIITGNRGNRGRCGFYGFSGVVRAILSAIKPSRITKSLGPRVSKCLGV